MRWTKKDIEKTKLGNNLHEIGNKKATIGNSDVKIVKKSIEKEYIKAILWMFKRDGMIPGYVEELQFHDVRKFRFDWAIPSMKIAIEYEGIFSKKSGHTTVGGYTKDCDKYNLATLEGWKVLRYTAKNYKQISNDLKYLLKKY
jgi:very-short-patch-repair endonuclease